jgi:hypothetical protein
VLVIIEHSSKQKNVINNQLATSHIYRVAVHEVYQVNQSIEQVNRDRQSHTHTHTYSRFLSFLVLCVIWFDSTNDLRQAGHFSSITSIFLGIRQFLASHVHHLSIQMPDHRNVHLVNPLIEMMVFKRRTSSKLTISVVL